MIKLTNIYHEYINIEEKPNDQFQKKRIDSTKIPILKSFENSLKMHEIMHEIMKIRIKGGVEREREKFEIFFEKVFESVKTLFLKKT